MEKGQLKGFVIFYAVFAAVFILPLPLLAYLLYSLASAFDIHKYFQFAIAIVSLFSLALTREAYAILRPSRVWHVLGNSLLQMVMLELIVLLSAAFCAALDDDAGNVGMIGTKELLLSSGWFFLFSTARMAYLIAKYKQIRKKRLEQNK